MKIQIGDATAAPPTFDLKVVTNSVVKLSVWIVERKGLAARTRADARVTYINSHFSVLQRQTPVFGLRWFNNDGMGDYLGRVDSASRPTVWPYNQVNDETGMGAVATWLGLPIRMAKVVLVVACGMSVRR